MTLATSWPFPVHACTDEDVNVSYPVEVAVTPGYFRGGAVRIGVVERSRTGGSRE